MNHYTDYASFSEALIGFMQESRMVGFAPGIQSTHDAVQVALEGIWLDKDLFEYALMSIMLTDEEDREFFKKIYNRFWRQQGTKINDSRTYKNKKTVVKNSKSTAVMLGEGKSNTTGESEDARTTTGANQKESIKKTDFTKLTIHESKVLDKISEKLIREMSLRIKRKRKKSKKGNVDLAKSIRKNLQHGSNIINLAKTQPKKEKLKLLILLDVSGSMDKYSFYLLKFLWSLRNHFKHIESFAFSTKLMRITDYLSNKNLEFALSMVSRYVTHWSSGTKIGECLQEFNEIHAGRYLNGKTLTIVLSDGLDTGEPAILDAAMKKIKLKSKKLVWLNPLKGMKGYEPIQRGMKTALPSVSHFESAHNFESLMKLESILVDA